MAFVLPQSALIDGPTLGGSWRATIEEGRPTYLRVDGNESHLGTTATKFELVPVPPTTNQFHIRCCLNKKYLRRESQSSFLIVAEADKPNEDHKNWSCTMFIFREVAITATIPPFSLALMQSGVTRTVDVDNGRRLLILQDSSRNHTFRFIPWETLVVLPRDAIFKGNNGRYLRKHATQNRFEFAATDPADPLAAHTIHQRYDGSIFISNNNSTWFLRTSGEDVDGTASSDRTIFFPVRIDRNLFALRYYGPSQIGRNDSVPKFLQINSNGNQLVAPLSTSQIIREARITVEEQVLSREIFNVVYRFPEAMIRDQENIMVATGQVLNASYAPNHVDIRLAYSLQTTSSWNSRIAGEFGIRSKVTVGIPFLKKLFKVEAEFEISANIDGEYEWGETVEESTEIETSYAVEVPPRSTMTIGITAFKATSDIPFSYSQRDTLLNGELVTTRMHDGLYTGANCYDFQYQAIPSPIEPESLPPESPLTMKSSIARRPNRKGPSTKV